MKLQNLGRERCIMKSIPAKKIDEEVLFQVAQVLSNPYRFAKEWLKDIDKEEVKTRFDNLSMQVAEMEKVQDKNIEDLTRLSDVDIRNKFMKNIEKRANELKSLKKKLKEAESEYNNYQNKADRLAEFEKAMKKASKFKKQNISLSAQDKFIKFIYDLPFKEKQRIIEAVIAPENGEKVLSSVSKTF